MFGYVRVNPDRLSQEELKRYEAVYCGLCRTMGAKYGQAYRLFLNYDFAFLAMLLAPADAKPVTGCKRCPAHPVQGRACCEARAPWLETAAGESVILTWWKLGDGVKDSGFWAGLPVRLVKAILTPGYRRAKEVYPDFDSHVAQSLKELGALEEENSSSLDQTAHCFANLLSRAVPETGRADQDRAMEQLLYHLGRWIYLVDAVDDQEEDRSKGSYNPVLARFPQWCQEDRDYLRQLMDHSLSLAGAAYQLLEPNPWTPIVENVLYSGLPGVEELVFTGKWREYLKKQRRGSR